MLVFQRLVYDVSRRQKRSLIVKATAIELALLVEWFQGRDNNRTPLAAVYQFRLV